MKMRRSRHRKKLIGSRQIGVWSPGTSPGPSYEAFTIPTPRGYPSVGVPENNVDTSLAGRKRPASDAEHVQDSAACETLLQHVVVDRIESEGVSTCQHSLDGGVGSAKPLQQSSSTGVKQIVLRLSGLRQSSDTTSGEPPSVNYGEPMKDKGTEAESQYESQKAVWSNVSECTENRQNDHIVNCSHPDLQSSTQNKNTTPTVRILHQALQIPCEAGPKEELTEAQKEGKPGSAVCGDDSGGCMGNLPPIDESRCMLDSSNGQARCGFGHELTAQISTGSFPHPANPSWIMNANVCRSCPVTLPRSNPAVSGCNACAANRFTAACSFQRGVPRAVRYYVEPTPLSQMKSYPSSIEPPACCQRMDFQGAKQPAMYSQTVEQVVDVDAQTGRGRNLALSSRTVVEGHTCGSHHMSGDDVLVCPAPWVHEGRIFPGTPAMGVNWAPASQSDNQQRQNAKLEENHYCEMPDPVYPPAHCSNCTSNFSGDLDMDSQHHLEEQIAHEILVLSQKLANLQARYGARRPVHNNTKPAVLSCPQTPLLLDNTVGSQKDVKSNSCAPSMSQNMRNEDSVQPRPSTSSSSRIVFRQPDSRPEERRLGGRNVGTNKAASSTSAPPANRGSDFGTTAALNSSKNHSHLRTGSRGSGAHNGCPHVASEVTVIHGGEKVFRECVDAGRASKASRTLSSPYRRGRERRTEEHVDDQCSYSDDMKDRLRIGGANVQGYPNGNKRFDWVKILRFGGAGVRNHQGCVVVTSQGQNKDSFSSQKEFEEVDPETWLRDGGEDENFRRGTKTSMSVSKSVQAGGPSPESIETCAWTSTVADDIRDSESRLKRRPDCSIENRNGKSGKRDPSPDELGGLDSRITHHLLKAGLRRAPSFCKTPGNSRPVPYNALRLKKKTFGSRSPRRDGGKRLRRRTLTDLNLMVGSVCVEERFPVKAPHEEKVVDKKESESQSWQLKQEETRKCEDAIDAQWQPEVADYEAEYETFVENTEDVGLHDNRDTEEYTSIVNKEVPTSGSHSEEDAQKRSPSSVSTQEKAKLSEAPVLSLAKAPPATKKTFIRCIELVVATKKKNQLSNINGRKANSGGGYPCRKVDCSERPSIDGYGTLEKDCYVKIHANGVAAGAASHNTPASEEQLLRKPEESLKSPLWNMADSTECHTQETRTLFPDSLQSIALDTADNTAPDDAAPSGAPFGSHPSVVAQVSDLASVLSRVMPTQMKSIDAEQLRARWEEFIDALETERLGLPKIKTSGRKPGVMTRAYSPRDSGCVKRIAEQIKSLRAAKLEKVSNPSKDKDIALEDAALRKRRLYWTKVEQKQEVVF